MMRFLEGPHERWISVAFPDEQAKSFFFLPTSAANHCERQDAQDDCTPVHTLHHFPGICILLLIYFCPPHPSKSRRKLFYFASA